MGLIFWALSALAALAGIRLAAVGLVVAGGLALASGTAIQAVGAAAAVTGAVLFLAGRRSRGLAPPVVAAACAVLAGTASNAAVFLVPWVVGTIVLASSAPRTRPGRTWAVGLLMTDIPVAAAGVWLVVAGPLVTWLEPMATGPAVLLAAGSVLRGLLPSVGPGSSVVGVRAQALVGLALASTGDIGPLLAVGGVLVFGAAGVWTSGLRRDLLQESGLLAVVLSVPLGGTGPLIALLAATTLVIGVRLVGPSPSSIAIPAAAVVRSCALGSPLWPVAAAVLVAVVRDPSPASGLIAGAVVVGLWGRTLDRTAALGARVAPTGLALAVAALTAGWTAPLLWGSSAWSQGAWPGPLALAVVAMGAALGALGAQHPDRIRLPGAVPGPTGEAAPPRRRSPTRVQRVAEIRGAVVLISAALASVSLFALVLGGLKGFL